MATGNSGENLTAKSFVMALADAVAPNTGYMYTLLIRLPSLSTLPITTVVGKPGETSKGEERLGNGTDNATSGSQGTTARRF